MGIRGRGSLGQSQSQNGLSPVLFTVNALSPPRPRTRFARPRFALYIALRLGNSRPYTDTSRLVPHPFFTLDPYDWERVLITHC